jgi:hypothetical protein
MMAQLNGSTETITGVVEQTNERGCKVGGRWYNTSQYRPVPLPTRGAHVALTVRGSWIEAVDVQDAHSNAERPAQPSNRETTITRLACLRSAVQLAANKPDLTSADVLKVAERFEAWVTRDGDAADA